ncbi:unnamed protein product [Caenorhabditis brenneri]
MSESLSLCTIVVYICLVFFLLSAFCLCKYTYGSVKVGKADVEMEHVWSILLFLNNVGCQKIIGSYKHFISSFRTLGMVFATVEILVFPFREFIVAGWSKNQKYPFGICLYQPHCICSIVNFQYGVMIYCGYTMHTRMEDRIKHFSENMRKHHKQFFKSLVLQVTSPTIVLFILITIIMILPVFNFNVSFPSGVMHCSFTLYPAMDSAILMYVVLSRLHR